MAFISCSALTMDFKLNICLLLLLLGVLSVQGKNEPHRFHGKRKFLFVSAGVMCFDGGPFQ